MKYERLSRTDGHRTDFYRQGFSRSRELGVEPGAKKLAAGNLFAVYLGCGFYFKIFKIVKFFKVFNLKNRPLR
jgi:hypothetical protein